MEVAQLSLGDFETLCKTVCARCATGDPIRVRNDTGEYVHDWAFGPFDPRLGRAAGMGHGLCSANQLRKQRGYRLG